MNEILLIPNAGDILLKEQSLALFAKRIQEQTFAGYPNFQQRLKNLGGGLIELSGDGPWQVTDDILPTNEERAALEAKGLQLDYVGRPLHPWLKEMMGNTNIGVVTGKAFYLQWGPNYTADPIVIRRDLHEPHVLLVERGDNTGWALPGGFIDPGETGTEAAIREAQQETGLDFNYLGSRARLIYQGPVVDLRMTANAWPETTAVHFELPDEIAASLEQMLWEGGDDAKTAAWVPISSLDERLFGSHLPLIQRALET